MKKLSFFSLALLPLIFSSYNSNKGVVEMESMPADLNEAEQIYAEKMEMEGRCYYNIHMLNGKEIHATGPVHDFKSGDTVCIDFDNKENFIREK